MKKYSTSLIFVFTAIIATIIAVLYIRHEYPTPMVAMRPIIQPPSVTPTINNQSNSTNTPNSIFKIPNSLLLAVPFTPQAPTGNWDKIHNEDCEEASSIMANAFYNGPHETKLDPNYVEGELTKLTDWEMANFGYNLDVTSEETVKFIEANFNLQTKILYSFTEEDIKNELTQNHLVLIPENGQMLGNPNYKQPGPIYHMLVIRGYTPDSIVTNDSGTRNGLNYSYSFDTLYNANGDYDHATSSVDLNKKNIIIIWK